MDSIPSDYDWESSSDSGSELEFLYGGRADSILSSLEESIGKIDDFLSFERGFVHGDIVCSLSDPSGQIGKVINVKISVDLENTRGKTLKGIDSKNLAKIRPISVGDYVVNGPWVGRVEKITENISVIFDDGTKCDKIPADEEKLVPLTSLEDSTYPYYPGQRVKARSSIESKTSRWLCGPWRDNQDIGTVSSINVGLVYVDWLASCNPIFPAPPRVQDANSLTILPCFLYENWQLGDWCTISDEKNHVSSKIEEVFVIARVKSTVDVMWQDGSCGFGLDSQGLVPISVINAHDFLPGQFVVEKGNLGNEKWGVVSCVDAKERTVAVKWGRVNEEIFSAYELVEHPDFSYCYGDIVFKNGDFVDFEEMDYLNCIGYVSGFKDGLVEVTWASGAETKVEPNEIFRVDKCESSAANSVLGEQNQETNFNQEAFDIGKQLNEKEFHNSDGNFQDKSASSSLFFPESTIRFFSSIAVSLFGSSSTPQSNVLKEKEITENCDCIEMEPLMLDEKPRQSFEKVNSSPEQVNLAEELTEKNNNPENFRQFEMVDNCSDHHFLDNGDKGLALSQVKRSWLKKVQQEWTILQKDLPESIYVRIYEKRMDLVQAAIVGAQGTPYHDGLFFFDIYLPPEYPSVPPSVHYRSGGLRVNPNLYESGKICLSLLNTWTGKGNEVWNPESSNILQVLLSLQALVLNDKPYFNEAGYDKQIGRAEGEKNSVSYNENAFLMTWKSMLHLVRNPPKHFEALVEEHLRRRSGHILSVCKGYIEGEKVDFPVEEGIQKGGSTGFKIMLAKLLPKLVEAFSVKGVDCSGFEVV